MHEFMRENYLFDEMIYGKSISIPFIDLPVQGFIYMGTHRDMLISSKAISYSKLFDKLCVRTQAFNGRTGILNFYFIPFFE